MRDGGGVMCGLPDTVLVGRTAVREYLGVGNSTLDKWHEMGVLVRHAVPGCVRGKYARAEVLELAAEIVGDGNAEEA